MKTRSVKTKNRRRTMRGGVLEIGAIIGIVAAGLVTLGGLGLGIKTFNKRIDSPPPSKRPFGEHGFKIPYHNPNTIKKKSEKKSETPEKFYTPSNRKSFTLH